MISRFTNRNSGSLFERQIDESTRSDNIPVPVLLKRLREKAVQKRRLREMFCYLPFLAFFFFYLLYGRGTRSGLLVTEGFDALLVSSVVPSGNPEIASSKVFYDIGALGDWWIWFENNLLASFFDHTNYNGEQQQPFFVQISNLLIGALRVRQFRAAPDSCTLYSPYTSLISDCYGPFVAGTEDTSPFGPSASAVGPNGDVPQSVLSAFTYTPCGDMSGGTAEAYQGRQADYTCGAHVAYFPFSMNLTQAMELSGALKSNLWLDRQTRAVIVEFIAYNPNFDLYVSGKLLSEFSAGGLVFNTWKPRIFKMDIVETSVDQFGLFMDAVCGLYVLYFAFALVQQFFQVRREDGTPRKFWVSYWTYLEFCNLVLFLMSFGFRISWATSPNRRNFDPTANGFPPIDQVVLAWANENMVNAFNALVCCLRVFKFLRISQRLNVMSRTLRLAAPNLFVLCIVFFVLVCGFASCAFLIFGAELIDFQSFDRSISTLLLALLGNVNYDSMRQVNRTATPIFFTLFIVLCLFVAVNVFLAIIVEAYADVQSKVDEESITTQIKQTIVKKFQKIKDRVSRRTMDEQQRQQQQDGLGGGATASIGLTSFLLKPTNAPPKREEELEEKMLKKAKQVFGKGDRLIAAVSHDELKQVFSDFPEHEVEKIVGKKQDIELGAITSKNSPSLSASGSYSPPPALPQLHNSSSDSLHDPTPTVDPSQILDAIKDMQTRLAALTAMLEKQGVVKEK